MRTRLSILITTLALCFSAAHARAENLDVMMSQVFSNSQASVHRVCKTLLKDRELIRSLSDSGYDMVAVAFDRQSQFDCL